MLVLLSLFGYLHKYIKVKIIETPVDACKLKSRC